MRVQRSFVAVAPLLLIGFGLPAQQQRIDLENSVEPGQLLDVDLPGVTGNIEIVGDDVDTVRIEGTVSAREWREDNELIVAFTDDGVRIYSEFLESRSRGREERRIRADLSIRIPGRFDIELDSAMDTTLRNVDGRIAVWTGNADIEASGLAGEAELAVANGNLRIDGSDFEGELSNTNGSLRFENGSFRGRLDSTNGGADIDRVSGDLTISATNGTVRLGDVAGTLYGETTNGSVHAGEVAGGIRLETVNGSVRATLVGESPGADRVNIETLNGSVEIDVPADLSATFALEVRQTEPEDERDRPEIRSDFPLDIAAGEMRRGDYYRTATGTSGSGAQRIAIRATNGDVVIRAIR
jgi:DUF4097 and DUF4098 domain-containing protein YvlB